MNTMTGRAKKTPRGSFGPDHVDKLRAQLTAEQRVLIERLWNHNDPLGWMPAKFLFHKLPVGSARESLEGLGGSVVVETQGTQDESYVLRLLGAFLSERGPEFEELLAKYLAYIVGRYDADPAVKEITSEEVERDIHLSEPALSDLPRLVNMSLPSFCSGSSRGQSTWTLGIPRDILDLAEVRDWHRFVRERALRDYDPRLPVRANERLKYGTRVQQVAQYGRKREAKVSLTAATGRRRRRSLESIGLHWITPFSPKSGPDWTCPTCNLGSLTPVEDSLVSYPTKLSREARVDEDWTPEFTEERASLALRCARTECGEYVLVSGSLGFRQVDGFETYEPEFHPEYVQPSPDLIDLPPNCPSTITDQLRRAFTLFWLDAPAAANRIRSAVEHLMDQQRVPKARKHGTKENRLRLHQRIELFRTEQPELGNALMAVKWIGNEGSHRGELGKPDLLKAFEMLSFVLDELLDQRAERVAKLALQVNRKRGYGTRGPRTGSRKRPPDRS